MIRNVVFGSQARVVLQSRTKFWKGDVPSINLETGDPAMYLVYQTADEVPGTRGVLDGQRPRRCHGRRGARRLPAVLSRERRTSIEQAIVHNWAKDPWAFGCERMPFPLGTAQEVLAAHHGAGRPGPLRRLVRRQPPLGHGRRHSLGQPRGRGDRLALTWHRRSVAYFTSRQPDASAVSAVCPL